MATITIEYNATARAEFDYNNINEDDTVLVELGPSSTPDVTVAALNSLSVVDNVGSWDNSEKLFDAPTNEPLDVEVSVAAAMKKIKLDIKPSGSLPGDIPV